VRAAKLLPDKKAVSPVVGVILMVAATIVIAAIVMAYLSGFKPPQKPVDIELVNGQVVYNDTNWTLTLTVTGADAETLKASDLRITVINSTGIAMTPDHVSIIKHSLLKAIGSNVYGTHSRWYINDENRSVRVIIKYIPTGQLLLDTKIIARPE